MGLAIAALWEDS